MLLNRLVTSFDIFITSPITGFKMRTRLFQKFKGSPPWQSVHCDMQLEFHTIEFTVPEKERGRERKRQLCMVSPMQSGRLSGVYQGLGFSAVVREAECPLLWMLQREHKHKMEARLTIIKASFNSNFYGLAVVTQLAGSSLRVFLFSPSF